MVDGQKAEDGMKEWDEFLKSHEKRLGAEAVEKWAKSLKIVDYDAGNLYLEASDAFQTSWFHEHLYPLLKNFKNSNGRVIKVHLSGSEIKKKSWKPVLNLDPDRLEADSTFSTFVPGNTNAVNLSLLKDALETKSYNPIYLQGSKGSGKSHLLMACAHYLGSKRCFYVTADTFTNHIVAAIRNGAMEKLRRTYRDNDVLLFDDVDQLAHRSATQEEFFHTFNTLHMAGKQIVLAGPASPSKLEGIEPRLTSRFEWGLVLPFHPLNQNEREQLLQQFPKETAAFLAKELHSTKFIKMAARMLQARQQAPLPEIQKSIGGLLAQQKKNSLTPEIIVKTVAELYGIRTSDILGRSQTHESSLPRQISMYLCRSQLRLSYVKIGSYFSRDHSTVMTAIKNVDKKIREQDIALLSSLDSIKSKLKF